MSENMMKEETTFMEEQHTPATQQSTEECLVPSVKVINVQKSYALPNNKLQVLRDVTFDVHPGEFLTITGPSGSGKTTLLSLLGALDCPDSGEIWLEKRAVHRLRGSAAADFRREHIGFIFQLFHLLPNLTALENVMIPLLPYRRKLAFDLKERAVALLEKVKLGDRLGHVPARLSGGEQQRVAIARALINNPRLILADEPTGNLDSKTGAIVLDVLRGLQQSENSTLIIVTHDANLASRSDRSIHLEK